MRKRLASRTLAAAALAMIFLGALFPGTAAASTVLAQGCTGPVIGNIGDQVAVQGKDLAGLVTAAAREQQTLLSLNGVDPDRLGQEITNQGAIIVGEVPDDAVSPLPGEQVAAAVTQALRTADGLGWDATQRQKTLDSIARKVTESCGLTRYAGNYSSATTSTTPVPRDAGTPLPGPPAPGAPVSPDTGAPSRNYGNFPPTVGGIAMPPDERYPAGAPLSAVPPSADISAPPGEQGGETSGTGVRNAGNASVVAGNDVTERTVRLPTLLAVVALAGASAALVRAWVLRKVS